jgi:hypothetical protein
MQGETNIYIYIYIYIDILVEGKSSLLEYQSIDWKMSLNYHRLMGCEILEWIGTAQKRSVSGLWL